MIESPTRATDEQRARVYGHIDAFATVLADSQDLALGIRPPEEAS